MGGADSLTGSATITGYTETVGTGEYGSLVWYMKVVESETSPSLSIAYTDAEGNGIRCDFTAEAGDWRKYSLPLSGGALSINGEETGFTSLDGSEDTFSKFTFTVSGSSSGTILLDEIHLADPKIGVSGAFRAGISYAKAGPILQVGAVAVLSDFSLTQEFLGSGARFAAGFIDSTRSIISSVTETSFSLFTLGIEAALYWDFTDSESLWGGSHTLTLPLGWVRITDSFLYRDLVDELLYEREDSVSITLPKALSWMLSSSSALINGTLKQIWKTSVDSTFPGPVTLAVDAELRQLSADFSLLQTGYFPAWINGFQQILPYKQDLLPKRYGEFSLSASVDTEPVGFALEPEFGYSIIGSEQRIFTTYGEVSLSLPLAFSRADSTEWGFSLDYSRNFSLRDETEGIGEMTDFVSDLRYMASSVAGFAPLYRSIPISEFFMESTSLSFTEQTDSCSEASYTPAVSLNFTMSEGSSWLNLFIPNIFRISLERELLRKGDTISDSSVWDLSIRSSVRNLFGRLGRYPLLPFYKTEEIIISGLFESKALSPFSVPAEFLFVLQQYLTFLGNKRNSLSIDNRLEVADEKGVEISTKDKLSLTYSWYADGIPLPRDIMERYDPSMMHEEIVMVRIEDIMEAENGFSIAFLPKHRTTLNLVDLGEISAYLGIGLRWEESGDEGFPYAFIAAVYGGLEAELEF
jgi:hypothetical protein